jgi:hypothetical protein
LIANILNGEGYSKQKAIVKEIVKAVLSEKRALISISFAAVILTLKNDLQMVKLIYNIPRVNDGKQRKDNDIDVTKYLEFNKDSTLNLTEKHYESLVEALTNNAIAAAVSSSSSTLLLPQSSSKKKGNEWVKKEEG